MECQFIRWVVKFPRRDKKEMSPKIYLLNENHLFFWKKTYSNVLGFTDCLLSGFYVYLPNCQKWFWKSDFFHFLTRQHHVYWQNTIIIFVKNQSNFVSLSQKLDNTNCHNQHFNRFANFFFALLKIQMHIFFWRKKTQVTKTSSLSDNKI